MVLAGATSEENKKKKKNIKNSNVHIILNRKTDPPCTIYLPTILPMATALRGAPFRNTRKETGAV